MYTILQLTIVQLKKKILNIHQNLMVKTNRKQKIFIDLLTSIISASNQTKCVFLNNQKSTTKPILNESL